MFRGTKQYLSPVSSATLVFLLFLSNHAPADNLTGCNFAEPYTGKKVKTYEVTLPVSRREKQTFSIPGQCAELNSALLSGAGHWGTIIERRLWLKVDDDCRYYMFLNQDKNQPLQDFVSGYDFLNADMKDLPIHQACDEQAFHSNPTACPPLPTSVPDLASFLSIPAEHNHEDETPKEICKFANGVFRGHLVHTPVGLGCFKDKRHAGFRILSVDYANINGDEYQDAILRLIPIGRGTRPVPMILPLTRYQSTGAFSIPPGAHFPELGPGSW